MYEKRDTTLNNTLYDNVRHFYDKVTSTNVKLMTNCKFLHGNCSHSLDKSIKLCLIHVVGVYL